MMKDRTMARMRLATVPTSIHASLRPELAILADGVTIELAACTSAFGCEVGQSSVVIDPRTTEPGRDAVIHFALAFALWNRLDGRPDPAARAAHMLAAAHATEALIKLRPRLEAEAIRACLSPGMKRLMAASMSLAMPDELAEILVGGRPVIRSEMPDASETWQAFLKLKPIALPAVALMLRDGDNRLDLDPESGCNRYGGSPLPRRDAIEFSSSTAADLSPLALRAAEDTRQRLMPATAQGDSGLAHMVLADGIKLDLLRVLGLEADGSVYPILAASGTTAMMMAAHIALGRDVRPTLAILVGPDETGRGVPAVVIGRHPAPCAPTGAAVSQNGLIGGMPSDIRIMRMAIRNGQGRPLPPDSLAEPIAGVVAREQSAGRRVVLHVLEGSKTGLVAPGIAPVLSLRRWFPDLPITVDACQWRTGSVVLRRYLNAGCMVALTGSKFMGGPPFSGALLVPARLFEAMAPLPASFADYSWRYDWPEDDSGRCAGLPKTGNAGLLLRWRAALAEVAAFAELPAARVALSLDEIGRAVRSALLASSDVALLAAVPAVGADSEGWASRSSIFTFAVRSRRSGGWLDETALRRIHSLLASDVSPMLPADASPEQRHLASRICHIGQPVAFTSGPHPAGLRLAIGARRIVAASRNGGLESVRRDIDEVMAKLRLLLDLER
jgi:hypothetical protein